MSKRQCALRTFGLGIAAALLSGCDTLGYYAQALSGQAGLWRATRPVQEVLADSRSPALLKERLALASRIREFASRELALPENGSYRAYADLQRPYVVWNVFAAEALSVKPKQWCFAFAGCVAYKGYFAKDQADALAEDLKRAGYDVFVTGVPAYSTLGYLDDPLLNTFIHYPPAELARLIFHELAHQVVYVRDDTIFNESFAVAVELEGVRRWIEAHGAATDMSAFEQTRRRRAAFHSLATDYRRRLEVLYKADQPSEVKLAAKHALFAELAREYAQLKTSWGGFKGYDAWLGDGANNASLASIAIYTQQVPAFQALLAEVQGDLPRFYAKVKELARMPREERNARLAPLGSNPG